MPAILRGSLHCALKVCVLYHYEYLDYDTFNKLMSYNRPYDPSINIRMLGEERQNEEMTD